MADEDVRLPLSFGVQKATRCPAANTFPAGLAQPTALPRVLAFFQQRRTWLFGVHGVQHPSFVSGFQTGSLSAVFTSVFYLISLTTFPAKYKMKNVKKIVNCYTTVSIYKSACHHDSEDHQCEDSRPHDGCHISTVITRGMFFL
jgi:hypothetical protein